MANFDLLDASTWKFLEEKPRTWTGNDIGAGANAFDFADIFTSQLGDPAKVPVPKEPELTEEEILAGSWNQIQLALADKNSLAMVAESEKRGKGLTADNVVLRDYRSMEGIDFIGKYGVDAHRDMVDFSLKAKDYLAAGEPDRNLVDLTRDTALGIAGGTAGLLNTGVGLANSALFPVDGEIKGAFQEANQRTAKAISDTVDSWQSKEQRDINYRDGIRATLDNIDRDAIAAADKADDKNYVDMLASHGREFLKGVGNQTGRGVEGPGAALDWTAEATGSVLAIGPVVKTLGALSLAGQRAVSAGSKTAVPFTRALSKESEELLAGFKPNPRFEKNPTNPIVDDLGVNLQAVGGRSLAETEKAALKDATGNAFTPAVGLLEGQGARDQAYAFVMDMDIAELEKSPEFQRRVSAGETPDQVRSAMAQTAGNASFPIGATTGMITAGLVKQFELSPFAFKGVKTAGGNARNEALEEGFQGGASQFAANVGALASGANPDQNLGENVGESFAQGALAGAGTVGMTQGPGAVLNSSAKLAFEASKATLQGTAKVAVAAAKPLAKAAGTVLKPLVQPLVDKANEMAAKVKAASPASKENVGKGVAEAAESAPVVAESLAKMATAAGASGPETDTFIERVKAATQVSKAARESMPQGLVDVITAVEKEQKKTVNVFDTLTMAAVSVLTSEPDSETHIGAALFLAKTLAENDNLLNTALPEFVANAPKDSEEYALFKKYSTQLNAIQNEPQIQQALGKARGKLDLSKVSPGQKVKIAEQTAELIATDPTAVNPSVVEQLSQNTPGVSRKSAKVLKSFSDLNKIVNREALAQTAPARPKVDAGAQSSAKPAGAKPGNGADRAVGLDFINRQINTDGGLKTSHLSMAQHVQGIAQAILSEDKKAIAGRVQSLHRFAQSHRNKVAAINESIASGSQSVTYTAFNPQNGKAYEARGVGAAAKSQQGFARTVHAEATALAELVNGYIAENGLNLEKIEVAALGLKSPEAGGAKPVVKSRMTPAEAEDLPSDELNDLLNDLMDRRQAKKNTPEDDATFAVLDAEMTKREDEAAADAAEADLREGLGEKVVRELGKIQKELSNQLGLPNLSKVFNGFYLLLDNDPKRRGSYKPSTRQVAFAPAVLEKIAAGIENPAVKLYRILAHEIGHAMDHGASEFSDTLHSASTTELAFDGALWKEFLGVKGKSNTLEYEPDWAYLEEKQTGKKGIFEREFFAELFSFVVTNPDLNLKELIPNGIIFVQEMVEKAGRTEGFEVADLGRRDRVAGLAANDRPPQSTKNEGGREGVTDIRQAFPALVAPAKRNYFLLGHKLPKKQKSRLFGRSEPIRDLHEALTNGESFSEFFDGNPPTYGVDAKQVAAARQLLVVADKLRVFMEGRLEDSLTKDRTTVKGEARLTIQERLDSGEESHRGRQYRALNIAEKTDTGYQYNQTLLDSAILAGLDWALNNVGRTTMVSDETAASILKIQKHRVTDDHVTRLSNGITAGSAAQEIASTIRQFWGVETSSDTDISFVEGVPEAVAKEVLLALGDAGFVSFGTEYFRDVTKSRFNRVYFDAERTDERARGLALSLQGVSSLFSDMALIEREDTEFGTKPSTAVDQTQLHNRVVPLTEQNKEAIGNLQAAKHSANPLMSDFIQAIGLEEFVTQMSGYVYKDGDLKKNHRQAGYNKGHWASVQGLQRSLVQSYEAMVKQMAMLEAELEGEKARILEKDPGFDKALLPKIGDMGMFYRYHLNRLGRQQMGGAVNPQNNKLLRHILMPTRGTVDLSDRESAGFQRFTLMAGQALKLKPEKVKPERISDTEMSARGVIRDTIVAQTLVEGGKYREVVKFLKAWVKEHDSGKGRAHKGEFMDLLWEIQEEDQTALTIHGMLALLDIARYELAVDAGADLTAFETMNYLEADGLANGIANSLLLFATGPITVEWLENAAKVGAFFGKAGKTMNMHMLGNDTKDPYETGSDRTIVEMAGVAKDVLASGNNYVTRHYQAFHRFFSKLGVAVEVNPETNEISIKRSGLKGPMMISNYGAGEGGIANNITKEIIKVIYEKLSDAASEGSPPIGDLLYGKGGNASFLADLAALTSVILGRTDKGKYYTSGDRQTVSLDPMDFEISDEQFKALSANLEILVVEPMAKAIKETVSKHVSAVTDNLQKMTQMQSIFARALFIKLTTEKLAIKQANPEEYGFTKGEFLSRDELDVIWGEVLKFAPMISTGTQNMYLPGGERADFFENTTVEIDGQSIEVVAPKAFSYTLDKTMETNAFASVPGLANVSAKPAATIIGGDGQMVNNFSAENPDAAKRTLGVFDGLQVPVDAIDEYLELINKAVYDSWVNNKNLVRAAYESFAAFMANSPIETIFGNVADPSKTDAAQFDVLREMTKIYDDTGRVEDQAVVDQDMAKGMLEGVLQKMSDVADETDARRRTYKEFTLSVEQMASGERPYVTIGTIKLDPDATNEQIADAMNLRYEFHLAEIRKNRGVAPVLVMGAVQNVGKVDINSGARVVEATELGDLYKGLSAELSPTQKELMRAASTMLAGSGYRIVFGNSTQLDAWEQVPGNSNVPFVPGSNSQQGKIMPKAKAILVASGQAETVIHELVHAATLDKVRAYYANDKTLDPVDRDAVKRIEILMEEWLELTPKKENEQAGEARATANAAISGYWQKGNKAEAVNEFMAWVLGNQDLAALAQKTKIKNRGFLIVQDVLNSLYRMIFPKSKKTTDHKVAGNILSNLRFNTRVLMRAPTKGEQFQENASITTLFQAKWFGEDTRLTEVRQRLRSRIIAWLDGDNTNLDTLRKERRINDDIVNNRLTGRLTARFVFHFPDLKKMQAASTFAAVQQAMMTGIELNPNALIRIEELYAHVVSVLKYQDFMKDPSSTDPNKIAEARDKHNLILGKLGTTTDKFGRSSLLSAFLGLALSSDEFRKVLSELPKPKADKSNLKGLDAVVENMGFGLIDWLSYTIAGESRKDGNVRDAVDNLTMVLIENVQDQRTAIERVGQGYVDTMDGFVADQIQSKSAEIGSKSAKLIRSSDSSVVKAGASLVNGIATAINKDAADIVALGVVSRMNRVKGWEPIKGVIADLIGRTAENAGIFDMISRVRAIVQQVREQYRNELPKKLNSMFTKPVSAEQWTSMFKAMGKTDLAALASRLGVKKALEMVANDSARADEIARLEEKFDPAVLNKAKQLAGFMVTGVRGIKLLRNAHAIAVLGIPGSRNPEPSRATVMDIDLLTSLYAIDKTALTDLESVSDLIKNKEGDGVEFVLSYLMGQRKDELLKVESTPRAKMNAYKGHIPSESQDRGSLIIASDTSYETLLRQGYTRLKDYTGSTADQGLGKKGYYYAPVSGRAQFNQGVLQTVHQTASGVDPETGFTVGEMNAGVIAGPREIRLVQRLQVNQVAGTEELSEVYDENGDVVAIERTADPEMLARLDRSTNLAEMIGAWRGRQAEELMAQQVNIEVIDELKKSWDEGVAAGRQNEFVNIGTLDPKVDDPILVEAAGLIPRQTVKYAESVFGKGVLMVRNDMLEDTFGARQASVGDLFTGNTRWNPKVAKHFEKIAVGLFGYAGKDAFTTLVGSEQNIQDVVAGIKQTIVVRSVIVPVANMTFNMFQLLNRGVPLTTVIRGMGAKTAEINSYVKKRKREIDLEADLRAAQGKNDDGAVLRIESQLQSIQDSYTRMSIWPLIEAGEFSAISSGQVTAEDLALSDGKWSNFIEKKINSLDGPLRDVARYGLVTRDTALFQGLARAVQYGDFVAKAVLYEDLVKRKKVASKDAVAQVNEAFVNYNRSAGRSRQYLESVGLLWFYNYKLRILKEAVHMLRNNPVRSLLMLAMPGIGSPLMDNVVMKGLEGDLPFSIGPEMAFGSWQLNPWINAVR